MSEAKLFVASGFNGGLTVGIRGDNYSEFLQHAQEVFGPAIGQVFAQQVFSRLLNECPSALAAHNADQTVGPVSVIGTTDAPPFVPNVAPTQPVGQAVPQPGNVVPLQQPTAAPSNPPTVANPGNCAHGPRQYKSSRTRTGTWNRWECALDWRKGDDNWNSQRCQAVNV